MSEDKRKGELIVREKDDEIGRQGGRNKEEIEDLLLINCFPSNPHKTQTMKNGCFETSHSCESWINMERIILFTLANYYFSSMRKLTSPLNL